MDETLVSVVIPAFNAEKYIGMAIESVLSQTYPDWELIIVDDASTDGTFRVATGYRDSRIKVLKNEKNMGPGLSRNRAIQAANGQWITFLDADDIWKSDRLEALLIEVKGQSGVFVADLVTLCLDKDGQLIPWRVLRLPKLLKGKDSNIVNLEEYLESGAPTIYPLVPCNVVKEMGILFPDVRYAEDLDFRIQLFCAGLQLKVLSSSFYLRRLTPGSLSSKMPADILGLYEKWASDERITPEQRQLFERLKNNAQKSLRYQEFVSYLKRGELSKSFEIAIKDPLVIYKFITGLPSMLRYRVAAYSNHTKPRD